MSFDFNTALAKLSVDIEKMQLLWYLNKEENLMKETVVERKRWITPGRLLMIIGFILLVGSLLWEFVFGGEEAIITSVFGTTFVILGLLWDMNKTLVRSEKVLEEIKDLLNRFSR